MFIIIIGISSACLCFNWYKEKTISVHYINFAVPYVKILYSEGIDLNKSNKSKECIICHFWYFVDSNYKYEPKVCDSFHDISMMAYELGYITILNVKGVDYRCDIWNMSKNDVVSRLSNSELNDSGSL